MRSAYTDALTYYKICDEKYMYLGTLILIPDFKDRESVLES